MIMPIILKWRRAGSISVLAAVAALFIACPMQTLAQNDPHHQAADDKPVAQENPDGITGREGMVGMMRSGGMMGMMQSCPMMGSTAHSEGRIAFLKAELAITDQQKDVWEAYAAAIKKNLEGMQGMRPAMMKVMQMKSPVERLEAHIGAMESRLGALKELKPTLANLYNALTEEQKKKADELLTGMGCMM